MKIKVDLSAENQKKIAEEEVNANGV